MMVLWSTLQLVLDSIKSVILDRDGFTGGCGGGGGGGGGAHYYFYYLILFGNGNPSDLITSDFQGAVYSNTIKNI